jgi:hypothetical protein
MLADIIAVQPQAGYHLLLHFEDGATGVVDVGKLVKFQGVFAPLADKWFFEQVRIDPDLGTVVWPGGADLHPVVLYSLATGEPLPDFTPAWAARE